MSKVAATQGATPASSGADDTAAEWARMIEAQTADPFEQLGDRVLTQDEIDALVGFSLDQLQDGDGGVRAIVDSGKVSYERLPMLEIVFDRMVRLLATSLRNFFSDNVEVSLAGITSVRVGDYLNSIPLPSLLAVVRAEEWDNFGLVTVEPSLIYAALDILLGGKRGAGPTPIDGRPFTTIETLLVKRLVQVVMQDAEQAFLPLTPVRFTVDRIESNPRFAVVTRPANAAILVQLRLEMDGRSGRLQILLPYATIEPIRDLLLQSYMGEKLGRDPIWEGHLATEIWQADLTLEAVLHETSLPLRRALALEVGDTLVFDMPADGLVSLRCGDLVLSEGRIGRAGDNVAIQVARPLRRSRTTLAVFEASTRELRQDS
ncbi:flagellar motor switch protein FliM [Chelatococcus sp. SYSU_G07232]|uniref:Flagellar motor switch protein FliM n=1 Tax=Chelatococcus albus TaxID=3047466 RepID=A0ABT7AGE5_9HYPH|nr:flagellar motor switch protein FliM [Chelatococcus sp. SYSU_G07232]MDJ1158448.1 flagellar motor switch protein FliM [Chelatococcus sp. SYSU_G07232]